MQPVKGEQRSRIEKQQRHAVFNGFICQGKQPCAAKAGKHRNKQQSSPMPAPVSQPPQGAERCGGAADQSVGQEPAFREDGLAAKRHDGKGCYQQRSEGDIYQPQPGKHIQRIFRNGRADGTELAAQGGSS